jgi:Sulfotransferase domain
MMLGTDVKFVWVASVPRCASMWLFNVTRQIARAAGFRVLPTPVPQSDKAMFAAAEEGLRDHSSDRLWVLKVHSRVRSDRPRSRFILPRRDIRDVVVSYMRFMRCDFEFFLPYVAPAIALQRHFASFPPDRALFLDYADIVARPAAVAHAVAEFLGAPVEQESTDAIASELSKENVAQLIAAREQDLQYRDRAGLPIAPGEVVVLGPRNMRAFDTETGFQSGHVSNYRDGDWKNILTAAQQTRLAAAIEAASRDPNAE